MKGNWFDPNKSFLRLPIVIGFGSFIILVAVASAISITINGDMWGKFDGSYQGFENFLNYYKFPLGTLALLMPVGGLFAIQHRSEQTRQQISTTQNQNQFINYYKHLEEFEKHVEKYLDLIPKTKYYDKKNILIGIRHIHGKVFPNLTTSGDISYNFEDTTNAYDNLITFIMIPKMRERKRLELQIPLIFQLLISKKTPISDMGMKTLGSGGYFGSLFTELAEKQLEINTLAEHLIKNNGNEHKISRLVKCYEILSYINFSYKLTTYIDCLLKFDRNYEGHKIVSVFEKTPKSWPINKDFKVHFDMPILSFNDIGEYRLEDQEYYEIETKVICNRVNFLYRKICKGLEDDTP